MAQQFLRAFVALEIPPGIRAELSTRREEVRKELPRARWTRPEGWHLTLKFLGETKVETLEELIADLRPRLGGSGMVRVQLRGTGFFPSPSRPRVAWVGGEAKGAEKVVAAVEEAAAAAGIERERRPWGLHLTQARIRDRWPSEAVEHFLGWGKSLDLEPFDCREVVLLKSDLRPDGAVYTALERFNLEC